MRAVIMCVAFLLTAPAWAQKEPCTTQNYDKDAEPRLDCPGPEEEALVRPGKHKASKSLKAGARAPWAGILIEKGRVIDLGLRVQGLRYLRWRDRKDARIKLKTEIDFRGSTAAARKQLFLVQVADLKKQNRAQAAAISKLRAWYRSPALWFAAGVIVTAGGTAAIIAATR